MSELWPFVISGIATGAIYGLAGTGLVLTYKTSGIFNFAHGAFATIAAFTFYDLYVQQEWDWKIAFVLAVFVVGPLMGVVMELIARQLSVQRTAMKIVGTIGIIVLVQGLASIRYGTTALRTPQYLPKGKETFEVGGVFIGYDQLTITIVALVAVAALYILFRFTRLGIAMRAVVDDPDLLALVGTSPTRVRRVAWIIGASFAALSGVLVIPLVGLDTLNLTLLVVQAFGAAAFGAFSSIPLTFLGGVLIGIVADVSKKYVLDVSWLAGLPASLPFIVLIGVLLVLPRRKLVPPSTVELHPAQPYNAPHRVRLVVGIIVMAALLLLPTFVGSKLSFFTFGMTQAILLLSLGLLVKTSGQVSLGHVAFAAIGATAFSQFRVDHGMPWFLALLLGALVVVPVGALVAIPAIRLSGLFLALATLGFGIMVERLFYPLGLMFTTFADGRRMPRPSIAVDDKPFYYLVLAFLLVTALIMVAIHQGRLGRILRGMSDSSVAMSTLGLSTSTTRVIVFCISAFFAGVAGILYGCFANFAVGSDARFNSFYSLTLLAILALAAFREPWYAVLAGVNTVIPAYLTGANTQFWLNAGFGFFAVVVALKGGPPVMPAKMRAFWDRVGGRKPLVVPPSAERERVAPPSLVPPEGGYPAGLEVRNLTVRFGGLVAVNDLTFEAPLGRITGLIGPNGAGKTTTFNSCSGLNKPSSGVVLLHGQDVSHMASAARGRKGLGRTFQRMELFDSLSVAENVGLGREAGLAGARVISQTFAKPSQWRATQESAAAAMELCGISHLSNVQAGNLSTGQRRLVELARCLGGPFDMLLLDEPSSGLDGDETDRFGDVLLNVVNERQCGILLVEHDMALVMRVCSYLYVLDFGELLFQGLPDEVANSSIVQGAYLGSTAVEAVVGAPSTELISEIPEESAP